MFSTSTRYYNEKNRKIRKYLKIITELFSNIFVIMSNKFDEYFSDTDEEKRSDTPEQLVDMESVETEEVYIPKNHRIVEKPIKKDKPKRERKPMTEERKAKLLENLKKGRETAQKNRQKRAEYKKILKQKERKKIDDVLEEDYKKRNNKKNVEDENNNLKMKIDELTKQLQNNNKEDLSQNVMKDKQYDIQNEKKLRKLDKEEVLKRTNINNIQKPSVISSGRKKGSMWK